MSIEAFYNEKRVCVTGGAGMVGQSLVRQLLELGAEVTVIDDFSRGKSKVEGARYLVGDASRAFALNYAFRGLAVRGKPVDVVFNLAAAVAGVLHNMGHQHEMFHSNIALQTVPVAVADELGIPHFLQVSSVCVYAPEHNEGAQEQNGMLGDPHPANGGYAWAKRLGERAVLWSGLSHAVIVRPSNIYGPGDYFDERAHVIPALIRRAYETEPGGMMKVYGDPGIVREFIYVDDAARGMLHALAYGRDKEAYNLGWDGLDAITIGGLADAVIEHTNRPIDAVFSPKEGGGDPRRWSDGGKAKRELDFRPRTNIQHGLQRTIEWYETTHRNQ